MPTNCRSFADELATALTGIDCPATAAWLGVRLSQDRPAELARVEAHWPQLEEAERESVYAEVVEGDQEAMERNDARIPHFILNDYATLVARAQHLTERP